MSTPATMDYTTQGDPNQVAASILLMFMSTTTKNQFLGTNNFFLPDGSDRRIHDIHDKVFHAGYLGEWQQRISLRTTWIRKDVTHSEVLNRRDVRTILRCVQQQLPVNVHEAFVTTGMENRRAH